jgi:hypothetical protein
VFNFFNVSTIPLQQVVDIAQSLADVAPILNVPGQNYSPALAIGTDVMNQICGVAFPWKWNELNIPPIYSTSFQQDYAMVTPAGLSGTITLTQVLQVSSSSGTAVYAGTMPDGAFGGYVGTPFVVTGFAASSGANNGTFTCVASSATSMVLQNPNAVLETHAGSAISAAGPIQNMSWLERGIAYDINNSAQPKPFVRIECGRQLPPQTAQYTGNAGLGDPGFMCNWFPNRVLYYGTWGGANTGNATLGNNPVAGSVYTQPLGNNSQPFNPITQIKDANGNFLLLTTYGTEGSTAPLAARNATPGTTASGSGATTVWTVLDPNGWGFRFVPVPTQTGTEWQMNLTAQMKPIRFVSLAQTLGPLPDEMEPHFRAGFIAQCYRYSPERAVYAKFEKEWPLWQQSLQKMRVKDDRELEENKFIPTRTVFGSARSRNNFQGGAWPFNYPRP